MVLPWLPPYKSVHTAMPWRSYESVYPPRSVAISGLPNSLRRKPLCTFGLQETPPEGPKLFQSVLYPSVPRLSWLNSGTFPPEAPGVNILHRLYLPPSPRPDTPHRSAMLTVVMVSLRAENGICTSYRTPPVSVTVGDTRHESCMNPE